MAHANRCGRCALSCLGVILFRHAKVDKHNSSRAVFNHYVGRLDVEVVDVARVEIDECCSNGVHYAH